MHAALYLKRSKIAKSMQLLRIKYYIHMTTSYKPQYDVSHDQRRSERAQEREREMGGGDCDLAYYYTSKQFKWRRRNQ